MTKEEDGVGKKAGQVEVCVGSLKPLVRSPSALVSTLGEPVIYLAAHFRSFLADALVLIISTGLIRRTM